MDFLNKENLKLILVDILKLNENKSMAEAQYDMMQNEFNDLAFENKI